MKNVFNALNRLEYTLDIARPVTAAASGAATALTYLAVKHAGLTAFWPAVAHYGATGLAVTACFASSALLGDIIEGHFSAGRYTLDR